MAGPTSKAGHDCPRCPRLVAFRETWRTREPGWFNAPVPSFGPRDARLLIVGLAPGLRGANRTGRPFTGDYAGILLYDSLHRLGLSTAPTSVDRSDGLRLLGVRITNAVKCLPPENKPLPAEIKTCNQYLAAELQQLRSVKAVLALGVVAHDAVLKGVGLKPAAAKFAHGAEFLLPDERWLIDSYHCSRYNTQTRRLTPEMFQSVLKRASALAGL